MQEIAVRAVQLDRVDAQAIRALCAVDEGVADALQASRIERQRRRLAILVRHRRRRHSLPAAFRLRDQLAAFPGPRTRPFAAGMGKLHRDGRGGMFSHR